MEKNIAIPLEVLLLNDLLQRKVIDETIYELAKSKITETMKNEKLPSKVA